MKIIKKIIAGLVLLSIAAGLTYCFFFTAQHIRAENIGGWNAPIWVIGAVVMGSTFLFGIGLSICSIMWIVFWSIKQFKPAELKTYNYPGFKGAQ